jgi:hypothetical protein
MWQTVFGFGHSTPFHLLEQSVVMLGKVLWGARARAQLQSVRIGTAVPTFLLSIHACHRQNLLMSDSSI